ncbi:MAG: cation transporter [Zetaproteobacteria bacterium]|nr:cation transporter [Pseudobdellovibrionaceae bacterium]|tara:strand:- start:620 stop:1501 length:882 start_codon:yes stop_codon:yes gene_type:complete
MSANCRSSDYSGRQSKLILSVIINLIVTIAQAVVALLTGSLSLLSDAAHNFSDVFSLLVSFFANKLALESTKQKNAVGFKRAEILASLINGSLLILMGLALIKEAVIRFFQPLELDSLWVVYLALFSFFANLFCGFLLKKDAVDSLNMKSVYYHLVSDAVSSLAVAIAAYFMYLWKVYWLDPLLTLLIAFYLVFLAYKVLKEVVWILMHFVPKGIDLNQIEKRILEVDGVVNIHHLHVWQLTEKEIHCQAYVDIAEDPSLSQVSAILDNLKKTLSEEFKIDHVYLQPKLPFDK